MKRYAPALFVIGVLIAAWLWWPTAERAVRTRISELVETLSPRPGESDLERLARLSRLGSALAPDITVVVDDERRIEGREAVIGAVRPIVQGSRVSHVDITGLDVTVGTDGRSATATLSVRVDERHHELRLRLVRPSSTWLVQHVEPAVALARPPLAR